MLHSQGDSAIEVADLIVAPSQRGQGLGGVVPAQLSGSVVLAGQSDAADRAVAHC